MAEAADVGFGVTKDKDKFQSCVVLKASIHCEGCKKKVKKLLTQVQGVNSVDVDTKLQKVTVFGTAHPDALLYKLLKSGKNAELWPQSLPPQNSKMKEKSTSNEKKQSKVAQPQPQPQPQPEPKPTSENVPKVQIRVQEKNEEIVEEDNKSTILKGKKVDSEETRSTKGKGKEIDSKGGIVAEDETKSKGKKKVEDCTKINEGIIGGGGGESTSSCSTKGDGDGGGGKKKKKKGQNGNYININNGSSAQGPAAPAVEEQEPPVTKDKNESSPPVQTNKYQPRHHQNLPRQHFYTPPPLPQYGVSYNTAYPTSSYTASYYPEQPPPSFAYAYPGPPPPPLDQEQPQQPLDSFEMFSDENPNGCIIM